MWSYFYLKSSTSGGCKVVMKRISHLTLSNRIIKIASFYITDDVKEEALSRGVMVLQRKGDVVETFLAKKPK